MLGEHTARGLATGSIFEVLLGVLVGGPAGALERWSESRQREPVELGLVTLPLAWAGAAAAFLQSIYAETALRTGSTDAGLEQLVKLAPWLLLPLNAGGLCGAVAATFAACAIGRRLRPDDVRAQTLVTLAGPFVSAVLLILVSRGKSGTGPAVLVTFLMSSVVGALLPTLCRLADGLEERLSAALRGGDS